MPKKFTKSKLVGEFSIIFCAHKNINRDSEVNLLKKVIILKILLFSVLFC